LSALDLINLSVDIDDISCSIIILKQDIKFIFIEMFSTT